MAGKFYVCLMEQKQIKCVTLLEGGAKDWGKHILMGNAVTLCGQPTPGAVNYHPTLKDNPSTFKDLIVPYKEEEWNITCEKCLELYDMIRVHKETKAKHN